MLQKSLRSDQELFTKNSIEFKKKKRIDGINN